MKALELQKEQEDADSKDAKQKMLHLANMMQYEDDFDDQNFYGSQANRNRQQQRRKQSSSSSSEDDIKKLTNRQDNDEDDLED